MSQHIRVIIVDDHLMVRKGLRLMLEEEKSEGIELIGEAVDGASALALVEQLQPDVVVMDIRMPGRDGITALRHIHTHWPHIAVLLLTTYDEDELMLSGLQAGACGYLLKTITGETLKNAICAAARGEMLIQPEIMACILSHTAKASGTTAPSMAQSFPSYMELTRREKQVLAGVARGERSKEIAARLGITERTVRAYLTTIYTKLNVDSRASAVAVALEYGLFSKTSEDRE